MQSTTEANKENHIESILQNGLFKETGLQLWQSIVNRQQISYRVLIYENGIIEISQKQPQIIKHFIFSFEIICQFILIPSIVTFYKGSSKISYQLLDQSELIAWKNILKRKLNQKGFHQQFKPLKKLGKGNFGTVFSAQKIQDNIIYAIKAFSKQAAYSQINGRQCIMKEIQIMRCLDHKNIMRLFQIYQSDNSLYTVLEYHPGGRLYDRVLDKYNFNQQQIKEVMKALLLGLRQMHSINIMHRDLKPQNILFRKQDDFNCVVADFGLAQYQNIDKYLFFKCGTPGYVAPQILNAQNQDSKYTTACDIYSLGLIFHFILFGKSVFTGKSYNQVLRQNKTCQFSLVGNQYDQLPVQAYKLLKQMLQINPQKRITAEQALKHNYFQIDQKDKLTLKQLSILKQQQKQKKQNKYPFYQQSIQKQNNQYQRKSKIITIQQTIAKFTNRLFFNR